MRSRYSKPACVYDQMCECGRGAKIVAGSAGKDVTLCEFFIILESSSSAQNCPLLDINLTNILNVKVWMEGWFLTLSRQNVTRNGRYGTEIDYGLD